MLQKQTLLEKKVVSFPLGFDKMEKRMVEDRETYCKYLYKEVTDLAMKSWMIETLRTFKSSREVSRSLHVETFKVTSYRKRESDRTKPRLTSLKEQLPAHNRPIRPQKVRANTSTINPHGRHNLQRAGRLGGRLARPAPSAHRAHPVAQAGSPGQPNPLAVFSALQVDPSTIGRHAQRSGKDREGAVQALGCSGRHCHDCPCQCVPVALWTDLDG